MYLNQDYFGGDGMRNKANKHLGIEIDPELHQKIKYIAEYEGRSINGQILYSRWYRSYSLRPSR